MDVHKLDRIFKPTRIALFGVTPNPKSVGGTVLKNLVGGGFKGVVYPINPTSEAVLGIQCYASLADLPRSPDLAVVCSPSAQVPGIVRACGEAGILGIIIISAGFREAGETGRNLEQQLRTEFQKFPGMRIIGPNCLGIIVPDQSLNISFASGMPKSGSIAFVSQSGALCTSVLDWALEENVGFSYFVSIGNALDVDFGDLIDYFGEDEKTHSIIQYVESIGNARKFMTAARAFARTKPVVTFKSGRFPESSAAAASHTGAMAGEDAVYDAAFQRAGVARVFDIGEIFDCADLIGRKKVPRGPRLGIITNAGGPGVIATDALIAANGKLAALSDESIAHLNENLPDSWSHGNPVDVLGDARANRIAKAAQVVLDDPGVDAMLVILTPQAMTNPLAIAKAISQLAEATPKPILAAWLGGASMRDGIRHLNETGIATYTTPEQAVRAFMTLVAYARNLDILYETPRDIPVHFTIDRTILRNQFDRLLPEEGSVLTEDASKRVLEAYGIPTARPRIARSSDEAVGCATSIGFPVVLKIFSPDVTHKTDVGGVKLNLGDADSVRIAFTDILDAVSRNRPDARIDGVLVQKMIESRNGIEMILGTKKDPVFGTVIMAGMGGIAAELMRDFSLGFPPLNERLARRMLESLRMWPLLKGYRGRPGVDLDRLLEIMIRLSYLVADFPEISEIDINPLLVGPDAITALDSRIVIDRDPSIRQSPPYSHLALHPYPEHYVKTITTKDGIDLILRPIKPEDEPMWTELLGRCSRESIYMRFRYFFQWASHDVAVRYCFIDYDREIAIVAEQNDHGSRKLLGVGRLVADPDHENVEYAVLIVDEWQNRGLGGILTDFCFEIAKKWGLKRIVAQTTTDNPRMIEVFRKRGFSIAIDPSSSLVEVERAL